MAQCGDEDGLGGGGGEAHQIEANGSVRDPIAPTSASQLKFGVSCETHTLSLCVWVCARVLRPYLIYDL